MIYSVWNQRTRLYDYFQSGGPESKANVPTPKHMRPGKFALSPDRAAWPLPPGANLVGSGEHPRGRIASTKSGGLGSFDLSSSGTKAVMLLVAGVIAWKFLR